MSDLSSAGSAQTKPRADEPPGLSIVVPVWNDAPALAALLPLLQGARRRGAELIVVDGGSRDDPARVVQGQVDALITAPAGRARQMNAGAQAARGELLWFVHADCRPAPGADLDVRRALDGARLWGRFDVRIVGRSRWLPVVAACMNARSRWTGIATGDQGLFMRRSAFDAVGGYADQPLMEDVAITRALRRMGPPACLPGPLETSGRRWDRDGAWRTIVLMWSLRWQYWRGADPAVLHARYHGLSARRAPARAASSDPGAT